MCALTYRDAGVDLNLYDQAMSLLPGLMERTHTRRVLPLPDGFAGLFHLGRRKKYRRNYDDPVLVTGTDGVGTKIKVAIQAGVYDTVGIDLVAMSVNDCLCVGAEPLFFLDYLALDRDDPRRISQIVAGVAAGCSEAGAALLGGETAIMPDLYQPGDFDLAGFCVGVVERKQVIDGAAIRPGDVVMGVASTGFHSNGYSLVRKIVFEHAGLSLAQHVEALEGTVQDALLRPTRIYVPAVRDILRHAAQKNWVHGLAHITGGGLVDNIERILPADCRVEIDRSRWPEPPLFRWLQELGDVDREEMFRVFNMGIGFVLIVKARAASAVGRRLEKHGLPHWIVGAVQAGDRGVVYVG